MPNLTAPNKLKLLKMTKIWNLDPRLAKIDNSDYKEVLKRFLDSCNEKSIEVLKYHQAAKNIMRQVQHVPPQSDGHWKFQQKFVRIPGSSTKKSLKGNKRLGQRVY